MQMFAFFMAVFSSASWLIYALMFVRSKLETEGLWEQGPEMMLLLLAVIFLPLLTIWMVFGYINQFAANRSINRKQTELLTQLQKNQDYTDLVVRVMLDAEHEIKDGFVINKFDTLINDMNEALSEIIQRCNIASSAQLELLWQRVGRGERWSLGKAVVEASKNQNTFDAWVREKVSRDKVFRGSLLEFCSRYQNLVQLLEKHDRDRIFISMIEKGVLGKVYSIIAPLSVGENDLTAGTDERVQTSAQADTTPDRTAILKLATMQEPTAQNTIMNVDKNDEEDDDDEEYEEEYEPKPSVFSRFKLFGRKKENIEPSLSDQDPFFKALHNSFKNEPSMSEPVFGSNWNIGEPSPSLSNPTLGTISANEAPSGSSDLPSGGMRESLAVADQWVSENKWPEREPLVAEPKPEVTSVQNSNVTDFAKWSNETPKQAAVGDSFAAVSTTLNSAISRSTTPQAERKDEDLVYPFGGWTDENNYRK